MRRAPARPMPLRLLLGLSALVLGCGRGAPSTKLPHPPPRWPAPPAQAGPVGPAQEGQPRPGQVPRMMVFAGPPAGVTVTQAPPAPEQEAEPTAGYASLWVACDSVEALPKREHLPVSRRDSVPVDFGFGGPPRTGCELTVSGTVGRARADSSGPAAAPQYEPSRLAAGLTQAGWVYLPWYQADGCDSEEEGWRSKETTCVAHWSWSGGDDTDSTDVSADHWDLVIGCAPWSAADSPPE